MDFPAGIHYARLENFTSKIFPANQYCECRANAMERFLFVKQDNNRRVMQSRAAISSGLYFQVP